jgi:hypothetical protein
MLKSIRIPIAATALMLVASVFGTAQTASADDTTPEPSSTLQSAPDSFVKYTSSHTYELPILDNDASRDQPDVMVCRYEIVKAGSFGFASLRDGRLELSIDPKYTRDYIEMSYQLCSKTEMGPETSVHIAVIRTQPLKPQVLTNRRAKLTNRNPDPVSCQLMKGDSAYALYKTVKVPGNSSLTTKVKPGTNRYTCYVSNDGSTNAGRGSFTVK